MNMDTWVIGTINQLCIRGSYTQIKFSKKKKKKKIVSGKTPFFVIGSFCMPDSICLNIGF